MTAKRLLGFVLAVICVIASAMTVGAQSSTLGRPSPVSKEHIYDPGLLKPVDSALKVKVGDAAPDFTLPSISGEKITLSDYRGKNIVVLSFVPAAFTPICSDQWPGYNLVEKPFTERDAIVLGVTTDNIPSLYAWTQEMSGVWFPVLSDFWPHGEVAGKYGVLRSSGVSERAVFVIDKKGVIRFIDVHDINAKPSLEEVYNMVDKLHREDTGN